MMSSTNGNESESSSDSYNKVPKLMSEESESEKRDEEVDESAVIMDVPKRNEDNSPSPFLPVVSLSQGLGKKETPLALKSWVSLALKLDGRDKITKVFQYCSRLLAWWLAGTSNGSRFKALYQSFSTSRKAFRMGRSFIEVQKLRDNGFGHLVRSCVFGLDDYSSSTPAWKVLGTSLKMFGLLGYWAGDNAAFITGSGFFDDHSVNNQERLAKRKKLKERVAHAANWSYYAGAIAGLLTGLRIYWAHRQKQILEAHERLQSAVVENADEKEQSVENAKLAYQAAREKQFQLFLAVLKSCCDIVVFSNISGINLVEKWRGKKTNEGLICLCGLTSASTVLYNNYPDASS